MLCQHLLEPNKRKLFGPIRHRLLFAPKFKHVSTQFYTFSRSSLTCYLILIRNCSLHTHFMTYLCIYMNQQYISLLYKTTFCMKQKLIAKLSWDLCCVRLTMNFKIYSYSHRIWCCLRIVSFDSSLYGRLYIKQQYNGDI